MGSVGLGDWRSSILRDALDLDRLIATITLSPSQLKNLSTAPVEMIAAPGPGKILLVRFVWFRYHFVTTPYGNVAGNSLELAFTSNWSNDGSNVCGPELDGFLNQTQDMLMATASSFNRVALSLLENQPLTWYIDTSIGDVTTGDGTFTAQVQYEAITL